MHSKIVSKTNFRNVSSTENIILLLLIDFNDSISKYLCTETNETIEIWTKILYVIMVKLSVPFLIIVFTVTSFYLYFIMELGDDAFLMPVYIK